MRRSGEAVQEQDCGSVIGAGFTVKDVEAIDFCLAVVNKLGVHI
jgi:hypothetical protein